MKTVFLFISNTVHTSDLLRTEYIHHLARTFRVIVFLPDTLSTNIYPVIKNVTYEKMPIADLRFWNRMKELRLTLNRENESWYEPLVNRLRIDFPHRKRLRFIAKFIHKGIIRNDTFTFIEGILTKKMPEFERAVQAYKPSLVLMPTPGLKPFEAQAVIQARKFNIPTVAMNFSWDNLTTNFGHTRKTDYLICWNQMQYDDALSIHRYTPDHVFIGGPIRFDYYFDSSIPLVGREDFLRSKGLDPHKKTILITSVTKAYPFQVELLGRIIALRDSGKIKGSPNIFFRVHPRDLIETYSAFANTERVYMEKAGAEISNTNGKKYTEMTKEDLLNLKHTLMYADVNVNHRSTVTIECCIFHTPVVNITFDDVYGMMYKERHYEPVLRHGAAVLAKTDEELAGAINAYLDNPALHETKRQTLLREFIPHHDGKSYERNINLIERIAALTEKQ
ncbi:MAG: hypothetical protein COU47_00905 [Candidatus Niyogibacteria bacterium CG10_big_fil_rev_8_21_14_0_10_46_36]|uniref:CDP-glycerol--glycerophosphate glycerophosphotransferase n=1 Tax=Candidatus Niyogibacteria bacterium CG10_big_fil_rev_8_21_14_0_10_46_36 TaxID=1974726 RepID=A0A2H0TEJ5_9BACT|nr:MAG: hypothetical protein COU47_00905 [Candidatus Niyogibacteria bacterium CG10_big_fil_rev_8_21_14_0_10_46_36]